MNRFFKATTLFNIRSYFWCAGLLYFLLDSTRWHKETVLSGAASTAARAPQTASFSTGSAPAICWGASALDSSRTEKILHEDYYNSSSTVFLGAQKAHAEQGDEQHIAFVAVGSLQNKERSEAGRILAAASMWGYVPFPIDGHRAPSDVGYSQCPGPWCTPG